MAPLEVPSTPSPISAGTQRSSDVPAVTGRQINFAWLAVALFVCAALFVAGRWSKASSGPTIVRAATASGSISPDHGTGEGKSTPSRDVQPTGEIKSDLAALDAEIRRTEEEDAKYSGGLVKALISSELHIYRQTRAMLQQRAKSWTFGIGLSFTVDGKPFVPPANASEQLAAVEQEINETRVKVQDVETEASRYSGGLVQAMSVANAATVRNTLAMLEQRRLALKYGLPQYIGFKAQNESTLARPSLASPNIAAAFVPPTTPAAKQWKIVEIDSRVTESNDSWWRYAWKLTIANEADSDRSFQATIEFQDAEGFVIDSANENNLAVPARAERTFTGFALVRVPGATRVERTNAKVAPR